MDPMPPDLVLRFDGGIHPNPGGVPRYGWTLSSLAGGRLRDGSGADPNRPPHERTSNVAEYLGLIAALTALGDAGWSGRVTVFGDSKLVVGQVNGTIGCRQPHLVALRDQARGLLRRVATAATVEWTPRDNNADCDARARKGSA